MGTSIGLHANDVKKHYFIQQQLSKESSSVSMHII